MHKCVEQYSHHHFVFHCHAISVNTKSYTYTCAASSTDLMFGWTLSLYSVFTCTFKIHFQLVGEREVKAVVRLKFVNVKGEKITCHRILQSEQKVYNMYYCVCVCVCVYMLLLHDYIVEKD